MKTRRTSGVALLEFALILPLILLLFAGVLDYTLLIRSAISVADAARAGALYGSSSPVRAADASGIQSAAQSAAPDIPGLTAAAATACKCSDGTSVSCTNTGSCTGGNFDVYVQVTARATINPLFSYAQLPFMKTVSHTASMRAK